MSAHVTTKERVSGVITFLLLALAFGVVAQRVVKVGMGPLPLGPGQVSPAISAAYVDGGQFELSGYKGNIVVLDFWATWCPPCVAAFPELERLSKKYNTQGVRFIGVNQEPNQLPKVKRFLRKRKISFPSIVDPGSISRNFGVVSFPTTMLIDHEGVLRAVHRGAVSAERIEDDIKRLVKMKKEGAP